MRTYIIKGFLLGILSIIASIVLYAVYSFSNLFYFVPVLNEVNHTNSTVLITLHNENELRPNLGFITGFILLTKDENGEISLEFHDSYDIKAPQLPIVAPNIIEKNFSHDSRYQGWVFRDSNFHWDFPSNAKNAIAFLQHDERYKNRQISAVVSVDMHAVTQIIESIGGVEFNEKQINKENLFSLLEQDAKQFDRSDENAWKKRKGSIKPLALAIIKKSIFQISSWNSLSKTIENLLQEKHILFYSPQYSLQEIFTNHEVDGNISLTPNVLPWGVNIANIGGKKGDRYMQKEIKSVLHIDQNGTAKETVHLQFTHNGTRNLHSDRYFGYVRLLKPKGTTLETFAENPNFLEVPRRKKSSFEYGEEFDFFFFIDPSHQENIELTFAYPENINFLNQQTFQFINQAGIIHMPTDFIVQSFADRAIKIDNKNCMLHENITSCSFASPRLPETLALFPQADTTPPIFEDVIYKDNGKKIRIQFSEELTPLEKSQIQIIQKNTETPLVITSLENKTRAIEITLENALSEEERQFYTVHISPLSDVSNNAIMNYKTIIAYPKYK